MSTKISDYMCKTLYSISHERYAHEAIDEMARNKVSALLVKKGDEYIGIITKTDWMFLILKGECDPKQITVLSLMTKIKCTIDENDTISKASAIVEEKGVRHIPVTRAGKIVGMFSVKDLEKYYLQLHNKTNY